MIMEDSLIKSIDEDLEKLELELNNLKEENDKIEENIKKKIILLKILEEQEKNNQ